MSKLGCISEQGVIPQIPGSRIHISQFSRVTQCCQILHVQETLKFSLKKFQESLRCCLVIHWQTGKRLAQNDSIMS